MRQLPEIPRKYARDDTRWSGRGPTRRDARHASRDTPSESEAAGRADRFLMTTNVQQHHPHLAVPVTVQDHAQGPAEAPVTLVEYGDYECPWCGRAYPIIKRLQSELGDRLRVVFRNFPLNSTHPHASVAAQAAE